jgi:hypothetical protein
MKAKGFLLMTTLLISGCAQVNDQFYSKKNFTSESFRADASECKRQNPFFAAIQSYVAGPRLHEGERLRYPGTNEVVTWPR